MIKDDISALYNTYLAVSRSSRNKPFKIRNDFDKFEDTEEYFHLNKIAMFLRQFPQIKVRQFFSAPFELYKDTEYFDLKFFTTQRAVHAYTTYMKQLQEESPDSEHHIQFIKDSLRFIGMFCIKNGIHLADYITHSGGVTSSWMKHIKEHNVSIYALFEYSQLFDIIRKTPKDELELLLGNILLGLSSYKNKYDMSRDARRVVQEGFKRVAKVVNETVDRNATSN